MRLRTFALMCAALQAIPGCGRPDDAGVAGLRAYFPSKADAVLGETGARSFREAHGELVALPSFARDPSLHAEEFRRYGLSARFPSEGAGPIRLNAGGLEFEVHEKGIAGPARVIGGSRRAVAYAREDGTAFWSVGDGWIEEWLLLGPSKATRTIQWQLSGAALREAAGAVEIVDAAGEARVRVTAPAAFSKTGAPVEVRLSTEGNRLSLAVPPSAGHVLIDPIWRRIGDMKEGMHSHTATVLPNGMVLFVGHSWNSSSGVFPRGALFDPTTESWTTIGNPRGHKGHTATLLPNGKVLVAGGGENASPSTPSANLFDVSLPSGQQWTATGNMTASRANHTATLLKSGKVLVAGGGGSETYDPATGRWTAAGSLVDPRTEGHAAVLMPSGSVVVACGDQSQKGTVEVFHPQTVSWSKLGQTSPRRACSATLLPNGKVLIAGGTAPGNSVPLGSAELLDATGVVGVAAAMPQGRSSHLATLLPNGRVLLTGGAPVETSVFDPTSAAWSSGGLLVAWHTNHSATLLPSGRVLVAGGGEKFDQFDNRTAGTVDFSVSAWSAAKPLGVGRDRPTVTPLPDGTVLVAGGLGQASAEIYDGARQAWTAVGPMSRARYFHTANLLPSGKILVAGGVSGSGAASILGTAEIFDPAVGTFSATGSMLSPRAYHSAVAMPSGEIVVIGGQDTSGAPLDTAEAYAFASGTWAKRPSVPGAARAHHTATVLPGGDVLVVGGAGANGPLKSCELLNSTGSGYVSQPPLAIARYSHTATLLPNGKLLVVGGYGTSGPVAQAELFSGSGWTSAGSLAAARALHTATLLPNGTVLVTGGTSGSAPIRTAEIYDPIRNVWEPAPSMAAARDEHFALLLPDGRALVGGGEDGNGSVSSVELFDEGRQAPKTVVPQLDGPLPASFAGGTVSVLGTLLTGVSEATGGAGRASGTNQPLLQFQRLESEQVFFGLLTAFSETSASASVPPKVPGGWYRVRAVVNAVVSNAPLTFIGAQGGGKPLGSACGLPSDCGSGFCRSGVCCNSACDGACQACSAAAGALFDGKCAPRKAGAPCRAATGPCDVEEVCDGASKTCPVNAIKPAGDTCRAAAGPCDIQESCDGTQSSCPPDVLKGSAVVCRPTAGTCDVEEKCTGADPSCPKEAFRDASVACRASAGPCDNAEQCSGTEAGCPADGFKKKDEACRPTLGPCDVAETCTGDSALCPTDRLRPDADVCRPASAPCDAAERCNGKSTDCPADGLLAAGTECRAAGGACDDAEVCDGKSSACPQDKPSPAGKACRKAEGPCEDAAVCTGAGVECPPRLFKPARTVCRPSAGGCDQAESCTGAAATCPEDAFLAGGAEGEPSCAPFVCTGKEPACPSSCRSEAECVTGRFCQNGECATTRTIAVQSGCGCHAASPEPMAILAALAGVALSRRRGRSGTRAEWGYLLRLR